MSDLVKLGVLWKNTSSKGMTYLKGKMGDADLVVFKTEQKDKKSEKSPDYTVYVSTPQKKQDSQGQSQGYQQNQGNDYGSPPVDDGPPPPDEGPDF